MNKKEVKKAPTLRFKGFTNDWEQRKFTELGKLYYGKSAPKWSVVEKGGTPCIRYGELYTKYSSKIDNVYSHTSIDKSKLKFSTGNELLIPRVGEEPLDFAKHTSWLSIPNVAIGEMITVLKTKENPLFLANYLRAKYVFKFARLVEGGNVSNLYFERYEDTNILIPSKNEQQNISKLILKIDKLITLQQRKLKLLKVMKKALSQYMFCQEIEFVPILRFNSFSDKWKYERLKNLIVKEIKGKAKADMKGTKSTYIDTALLNGGSITKVDSPTDTFHNDIIILWDGSQAGKIYHGFTGALGSTLKSYKPKYSGGFLYQYLKSKEPIIFLRYRTPNIPHVVKDFTEIFKINVPSVKEQEKISKTLNYLDQSILVETKKIGSIKKIKKFLLQNMFI